MLDLKGKPGFTGSPESLLFTRLPHPRSYILSLPFAGLRQATENNG
ncbi:MAG TPA: hypothetical protein VFB12_16020 [Ktedonobacteraceae bacterium]|nr:hypothetical protein [Ktedonobacteraceae bacterium]